MFKISGINVYPSEVEKIATDNEDIHDASLEYFNEGRHTDGEYCTMCGPHFCAMKLSRDLKEIK